MDDHEAKLREFSRLVEANRPREAFVLFIEHTKGKSWAQLEGPDLDMLDKLCCDLLPELIERHTLWLTDHPDRLRRMVHLLIQTQAPGVRYCPPRTLDQIATLRCLLAISEARAGRDERAHEELSLARGAESAERIPDPNGPFRDRIRSLRLTESSTVPFLEEFFAAYVEFLRRAGQQEHAAFLESRIGGLLGLVARDERRPGVVQALLYEKEQGYSRFVHVSLKHHPPSEDESPPAEDILYAGRPEDTIDAAMQEAARCARVAADAYLRRAGYPDGLAERVIRWELATLRGDTAGPARAYEGGSVALPLAIAIVSEYVGRAVSNDVALTGALTAATAEAGQVVPVDGIPVKLEHALVSGSRLVYLPAGNSTQVSERPCLSKLAAEHNARLAAVERLDEVCIELFPPEGSGRLGDTLRDAGSNVLDLLVPRRQAKSIPGLPVHQRHRLHMLAWSALIPAAVLLEGWMVYKAFAPAHPAFQAWLRIAAGAGCVLAGMLASFALPAACLRHRKSWSWLASIALLGACFSAAFLILEPMLPLTTSVSRAHNAPPAAGLMKDLFVIWFFAWAIAANVYNVVAADEHLVRKRQFVTARDCLRWNAFIETRMPIRCFPFPWNYGGLAIALIAALLLHWEVNYYGSLYSGTAAAFWLTYLGLSRDMLLAAGTAWVMIFYRMALAHIRRALA